MTAIRQRCVLPLALAATVLGLATVAQMAAATHPRPKAASPLQVSLVPAYEQCTAPNRTHGPPLAFPSCNPPAASSPNVTVGTADANGAPANSTGYLRLFVKVGVPGPPNDTEVLFKFEVTDVRCESGTSTCGNTNSAGGRDYTGELKADATIRITDHWNAASPGGGSDPATVVDIPMPVHAACANTADPAIGATCTLQGGPLQPAIPDPCSCEGKRMVVEVGQFRVDDGGPDGLVGTTPNSLFMKQGIFIP